MSDRYYFGNFCEENDEDVDVREIMYCRRADSQMQWMEDYLDAMEEMENVYQDDSSQDMNTKQF